MVTRDISQLLPRSSEERGLWLYAAHLLTVWALAISNACMVLAALAALPRARGAAWGRFAPALKPLGLYALFVLAAVAGSYDPRLSLGGARELLSLITLPLAFVLLGGSERRIRRLVDALAVLGSLLAVYGLAQLLVGFGGLYQRIRGPFSHWMTFAGVLVICLLLLAARLAHRPAAGGAWRWLALALMSAALVMSLTRSAWLGLLLALTVLLALRAPRYLAVLPAAGLLLVLLAPVRVVERMT